MTTGRSTKGYRDLIVWQKAYALTKEIYQITKSFPGDEKFGMVQQMRRSAVSIPSNIAEGYGRNHAKEYKQFLSVALGSLYELETQCLLAIDLEYVSQSESLKGLISEVGAMLYRMINPLTPDSSTLSAGRIR